VSRGHGGFFLLFGPPALWGGETFAARLQEKAKQGLPFEWWLLCPAGTAAFLCFSLCRLRGGEAKLSRQGFKRKQGRACPLNGGLCALRAQGLFFILAWAACAAGGRWGPVRGCRPSEAPSALPPDDPAGFVVYPTLPRTGLQGPSISHHSARAARRRLRELPRFAR
jgi:hypothetical protein